MIIDISDLTIADIFRYPGGVRIGEDEDETVRLGGDF